MRKIYVIASVMGLVALQACAQPRTPAPGTGFTSQELDRMSKEKLDAGAYRGFASGPTPRVTAAPVQVRQPRGLWVCRSTDADLPILATPNSSSLPIGRSDGQVAAGTDTGTYTSILVREGRIGYIPTASVRPYQNEFNPRASCSVAGFRPDGMLQFSVR